MLKRILVPVDFTNTSMAALRKAAEIAAALGSELICLHVDEFPVMGYGELSYLPAEVVDEHIRETKRKMDDLLALATSKGWNARGLVVRGPAATGITSSAEAQDADIIVMGTHGRRGYRRLVLGSVAEQVIRTSKVPVMTVSVPASASVTPDAA